MVKIFSLSFPPWILYTEKSSSIFLDVGWGWKFTCKVYSIDCHIQMNVSWKKKKKKKKKKRDYWLFVFHVDKGQNKRNLFHIWCITSCLYNKFSFSAI